MSLLDDLNNKVSNLTCSMWFPIPNARVLPTASDLTFGNTAEYVNVTILYADIKGSTLMVDTLTDTRSAEYYKAFLYCSAKIIKANGGTVQAYDGDRVMAVFLGDSQADDAVRASLQINFAVLNVINPGFAKVYTATPYILQHTVGVDKGKVLVAKTGVRIDSDLVWVGPAANYAAKLNSFPGSEFAAPTRITQSVFDSLSHPLLYGRSGEMMWAGPYTNIKRPHFRSFHHIPVT